MPLDTRQITPFGPQPTLLDRIREDTLSRAAISRTTREEDVAQRTAAAYRMLEGIADEAPSGGYGALFGQRASSSPFRTQEDAAAFLRATDPQGMSTRQQAVGEFMANQALPRLGTVTDPAQRVSVLREMAATGPAILNTVVSKIAADGVITDEEMAQAQAMYESYKKPDSYVNLGQQGVFNATEGSIVAGTARTQPDVPSSAAGLDWAYRNRGNPAAEAIIAKDEADRARIGRANRPSASGAGPAPRAARTSWQVIGGRKMLVNNDTGDVIRDAGVADTSKPAETAGGLATRFFESMVSSAASANAELANIMNMPATASSGIFGIGAQPGESVVRSTVDALRNGLASDEVQNYNQQVGNMARSLTYLETGGRATNESAIEELRKVLVIRDTDNGFVVLQRLATVRQLIEKYLEPKLRNPRLTTDQKDYIREQIAQSRASVPWTVDDVTRFQRGGGRVPVKRGESFIEWARRSMGGSARPAQPSRLDTTNPFATPLGTPAAPLNMRPAAPAAAPANGATVDWNDL